MICSEGRLATYTELDSVLAVTRDASYELCIRIQAAYGFIGAQCDLHHLH